MNQPELFDVDRTIPKPCPVGTCPAIRLPGETQVPTCPHDLQREGPRPRGCLNTYRPEHTEIPY